MVDRGDVYAENSSGPRTDPWGTPTEHEVTADEYVVREDTALRA